MESFQVQLIFPAQLQFFFCLDHFTKNQTYLLLTILNKLIFIEFDQNFMKKEDKSGPALY